MAVVKEFRCLAHGPFEATKAVCPYGCDTVTREFRTPVGFASDRTKSIDRTVEGLARAHNLSDINNRGGQAAVRQNPMFARQQRDVAQIMAERYGTTGWGKMAAGGTYNVAEGRAETVAGRAGNGAVGAVASYGGHADNALAEVRDHLKPKPVNRIADPENLKLSDARPPA
jgi:hypothetical protein